jgi:hypothetical protein
MRGHSWTTVKPSAIINGFRKAGILLADEQTSGSVALASSDKTARTVTNVLFFYCVQQDDLWLGVLGW